MISSDWHLDHDHAAAKEFVNDLDGTGVDLLILAGDEYSIYRDHSHLFAVLLDKFPEVLWVNGNHALWRIAPDEANKHWDKLAENPRLHMCHRPRKLEIQGQKFLAGTMWYKKPEPDEMQYFIDMREINAPAQWIFDQHKLFVDLLAEGEQFALKETIVVTHHLPHPNSTPARFVGSPHDIFFMSNMTDYIVEKTPKLWVHGHSHDACDYTVRETRIVNSPRGYPFEYNGRREYKPLLIDTDSL